MVQTKITLQMTPRDMRIINEALILLVTRMEDAVERPEAYVAPGLAADGRQLEMFRDDARLKASEARAIMNAIN